MKILLIPALAGLLALNATAQTTVILDNDVFGSLDSPIYGVELGDPTLSKTGNTSAGTPSGGTTYAGSPLSGDGYRAQLYFAAGCVADQDILIPAGPPTTFLVGDNAGYLVPINVTLPLPPGSTATLQLRAWQAPGGIYTTWSAAEAAWLCGLIPAGRSSTFCVTLAAPPGNNLDGLLSFNLYYKFIAQLAVSPTNLIVGCTQGTDATAQSFGVWNTGDGTLSYTINESVSWLSCTPTNDTSTGESNSITVNYSTASLATGAYNGTITVTAPGMNWSTQEVAVRLYVSPPPELAVTPTELNPTCIQGYDPWWASIFGVRNSGGGTFSFTITNNVSWFSCHPTNGVADHKGPWYPISVHCSTADLPVGTYTGTITVTAPGVIGSPRDIPVTLTVVPPPAADYPDTAGDLFPGAPGSGILDITFAILRHTVSNITFKIYLDGDPTATDWGKYIVAIHSEPGGDTTGNPWLRPIGMDVGLNYWLGSWVDGSNGITVWHYSNSVWQAVGGAGPYGGDPQISGLSVTKDGSSVTITSPLWLLGLGLGQTFQFDIYTSGGGGSDGAIDALANRGQTITNWAQYYNSGPNRLYSYTLFSANADLASLLLSAGTLVPAFDPAVTNYTASVFNNATNITATPGSGDSNATIHVRVNGGVWSNVLSGTASPLLALNAGPNLIDVKVTAHDSFTTKTYSITILSPAVLRVALTTTNTVLLAWPSALAGFDLEQNAGLTTTDWTTVTNSPVEVGSEKQVILPPTAAEGFYRLHKP